MSPRWLLLVITLGVVIALPACKHEDPAPSTTTTTTTPPTTAAAPPATTTPATDAPATTPSTTPMSPDEQAIRDTIDGFWRTWLAANNPPNPDHPDLARYFTGPARKKAIESISKFRQDGQYAVLPPNSVFRVTITSVSVDGPAGTAKVCVVDDSLVIESATGRVINDRVASSHIDVALVREAGVWKVSRNDFTSDVEGAAGCDA